MIPPLFVAKTSICKTVLLDETEYPCVPLKLQAKGNAELFERLLQSGACSKMDGCTENGKRYRRVLLWIEPDCSYIHRIRVQQGEKIWSLSALRRKKQEGI